MVTEKPAKVQPITTTTTQFTAISLTRAPPVTTPRVVQTPPSRQYLCNVTKPELYLVRVGESSADYRLVPADSGAAQVG